MKDTLAVLLQIDKREAAELIRKYGGYAKRLPEEQVRIGLQKFQYPSGTKEMNERHRLYLDKRGFDPERLERRWGLLGTGPIAPLDYKIDDEKITVDYKHRIIAPITWDKQIASFQARDITGKHSLRYITCPKSREIVHHKHIVYGDQTKWKETGIVVEGITGVWRFGPRAVATFGIEFTHQQAQVIAKAFQRVFVVFDNEPQAQEQGQRLIAELLLRGIQAYGCCVVGTDSGAMNQDDANHLVRQLTRRAE